MTPIVVVAYNRPQSLQRLLSSLEKAKYPDENVLLIISIDKGDNKTVLDVAEGFQWRHGVKEVRYQEENLKLRKHILKCGDLALEYGSIIVLEDDLLVSEDFYHYSENAIKFVENEDRIGGISLYAHAYNVNVFEPFSPIDDGFDNWYFQFASSWGEVWTKKQWMMFKEWYSENEHSDIAGDDIPVTVTNWSNNSWLKYYIKYLIETNRFFFYPRVSLTTNFSAKGTHIQFESTTYQVPLSCGKKEYTFSALDESDSIYDSFFENTKVGEKLGMEELSVDLYGSKKPQKEKYLLSCNIYNYKIMRTFGRLMRPHDANILYDIEGEDFFLYDTSVFEKNMHKTDKVAKTRYCIKLLKKDMYKQILKMFFETLKIHITKKK